MDSSASPELSVAEPDPMDFASVQLTLLRIIGLYPPQNSSRNKTIAYSVYTAYIMVLYVIMMIAEFKVIQEFWGVDLFTISGIMFETLTQSFSFLISCGLILNQNKLHALAIEMTPIYEKFQDLLKFETKDKLILIESAKKSKQFSQAMMGFNFMAISPWILVPFLNWLTRPEDISAYMSPAVTVGNDTKQYPWGFFITLTWLPQGAEDIQIYFLPFLIQLILLIHLASALASFPLLFCGVIEYTASHFQILCNCLEGIDDFLTEEEFLDDETEILRIDNDNTTIREIWEQIKDEDEIISQETDGAMGPVDYLSNCIKYHQEILNLCDLAQDAFSSALFFTLVLNASNVTFGSFLSTELPVGDISRNLLGSLSCVAQLLLICWYGQKITDQSAAVEQVVYGCKWYHGSATIKKNLIPIIVRSQSPVVIKALGWYPLNLEGFSTVANKIYGYFTILKGMKEE